MEHFHFIVRDHGRMYARLPQLRARVLMLAAAAMLGDCAAPAPPVTPFDTGALAAIDQAIELAKRFSAAESGAFVNGVLDRVLRIVKGEAAAKVAAAPETPKEADTAEPPK